MNMLMNSKIVLSSYRSLDFYASSLHKFGIRIFPNNTYNSIFVFKILFFDMTIGVCDVDGEVMLLVGYLVRVIISIEFKYFRKEEFCECDLTNKELISVTLPLVSASLRHNTGIGSPGCRRS
jgi:hypothetical protein